MCTPFSFRWVVVAVSAAMLLVLAAACGETKTIEVPGETVVLEKEVIKTVEVPGGTKTIEVPGETVVVEKEVVKKVEVPGETVTIEVPGETVVVEKEVLKVVEVVKEVVKIVEVPVEREVVRIGLLTPQTGPIAQYAPGFADAAEVAISELNVTHEGDFEFELIVADSGCDATQAATAAQTLIDSGVSVIIGAACSGATLSAITVAAAAGVPMVSYASTSPAVTTADDNGYLFRVVPSDSQQAVALVAVASAAGAKNPAVLYMTNDYGAGLGDNFASNWSGSTCTQNAYDPTEGSYDASAIAQSVIDGGCDSVLLMSYATDGAAIMEALSAQGFTGTIIGADGVADAAFTESFTDVAAVDGLLATRPRPGEASSAKTNFESAYAAAGGADGAIYTGETYDAIKIAAAAIVSDPDGYVVAALKKIGVNYVGASGTHTFDAAGDVLGTGYEVCQFDGTSFSCPRIWTADGGLTQ